MLPILLLLLVYSVSCKLTVTSPVQLEFPAYWTGFGNANFQVNGTLLVGYPFASCEQLDMNSSSLKGAIVLLGNVDTTKCYVRNRLKVASMVGVTAVIVESSFALGHMRYECDKLNNTGVELVSVEVDSGTIKKLKYLAENNPHVTVEMSPDKNPWEEVNSDTQLLLFTLVYGLLNLTAVVAGMARIIQSIWKVRKHLPTRPHDHMAQVKVFHFVLLLEILSSLLRLVWVLDPIGTCRGFFTWNAKTALTTSSFSFSLSAFLLMTLDWNDKLNTATPELPASNFTLQGKISYWVQYVSIVLISVAGIIRLSLSVIVTQGMVVLALFFTTFGILCFTFCAVSSCRLVIFMRNNREIRDPRLGALLRYLVLMMVCFLTFIVSTSFVGTTLFKRPGGYTVVNWIAFFALTSIAFIHIAVVELKFKRQEQKQPLSKTTTGYAKDIKSPFWT